MNGIEITQALEILTGILQVLDKLGILIKHSYFPDKKDAFSLRGRAEGIVPVRTERTVWT